MKEFLALGVGGILVALVLNIAFWYAIVFYIVIPGIAKLREIGIF